VSDHHDVFEEPLPFSKEPDKPREISSLYEKFPINCQETKIQIYFFFKQSSAIILLLKRGILLKIVSSYISICYATASCFSYKILFHLEYGLFNKRNVNARFPFKRFKIVPLSRMLSCAN